MPSRNRSSVHANVFETCVAADMCNAAPDWNRVIDRQIKVAPKHAQLPTRFSAGQQIVFFELRYYRGGEV